MKRSCARGQFEEFESRCVLSASVGSGAPDLDISAIPSQEIRVGQRLDFNLFTLGAVYSDPGGADSPRNMMLDPDPEDTPAGALLTRTGQLTWTPTVGQIGSHLMIVIAIDDGSPPMADVEFLTIRVIAENSPPTFDIVSPPPTIEEDAGLQTITDFATNISAGAMDESGQALQFVVTNLSNPELFATPPAISPTGILTYTPANNANGMAEVTVVLMDDGGTANGGNDTSLPATFVITVSAVNDPPLVTLPTPPLASEDTTLMLAGITVNDVEVAAEEGQVQVTLSANHGTLSLADTTGLTFLSGTGTNSRSMSFLGELNSVNAALVGLSYRPDENFNGAETINVQVSDLGASGGGTRVTNRDLGLTIDAVNDAPTVILPADQTAVTAQSLSISGVSVGDVDVAEGTGGMHVTLSVTHGILRADGDGLAGQTISTTGSEAVINAILAGLTYQSDAGFVGSDTLTVTVNDQGNTGAPGPLVTVQSLTIDVIEDTNTAPDLAAISDVVALPDVLLEVPLSAIDADGDQLTFQLIGSVPTGATLVDNGDGTGFIRWTPTAGDVGPHDFGVVVNDDGVPPKSDFESFTVTVQSAVRTDSILSEIAGDLGRSDFRWGGIQVVDGRSTAATNGSGLKVSSLIDRTSSVTIDTHRSFDRAFQSTLVLRPRTLESEGEGTRPDEAQWRATNVVEQIFAAFGADVVE